MPMIKARKAIEITEQAYIKKRDALYQNIDDTILRAANEGLSYCHINDSVYFDDTIKQALITAGYNIRYIKNEWGNLYKISWSDDEC